MKKPISDQGVGEVVLRQTDLTKADTISVATGLSSHEYLNAPRNKNKKRKSRLHRGPRWLQLTASIALLALVSVSSFAAQPTKPIGQPTLNQSQFGLSLTKDDVATFPPTRGLHIGDASACNLSVVFSTNPGVAVSINSVQPGQPYPYSIIQLKAATTCTDVVGLW